MKTLSAISRAAVVCVSFAAFSGLAGCSGRQREPQVVRAADLGRTPRALLERPLVIEFDEGDTLPLTFALDGPFMKTAPDAPVIPLRVVRHFYLRLDDRGLRSSLDGRNFDEKPAVPGKFQVGVGSHDGKVGAVITITTPIPKGLTALPKEPSR